MDPSTRTDEQPAEAGPSGTGPTWYDLLGLDRDADATRIRAAWREATDRATPGTGTFRSYNQAAETLLDPTRRAAYDASLPPEEADPEPTADPVPTAEPVPGSQDAPTDPPYAGYGRRVLASLLDGVVGLVALLPLLGVLVLTSRLAPAGFGETTPGLVLLGVAAAVPLLVGLWNLVWRQGRTGQSVGKRVLGIELAGRAAPGPVGIGRAFARWVLRPVDTAPLLLGLLWPLWDRRRQTFSDKLVSTVVVRSPASTAGPARSAVPALVLVPLAIAAAAAVALGVLVLQDDGAAAPSYAEADQARVAAEEATTAILTYDFRQLPEDRARAERYLTGDFKDSYLENFALLEEQPDGSEGAAIQTQAVVTAQVRSSGVVAVGEDGDRARVLLFVDQTSEREGQQPQVFQNRVSVAVDRVGDRWLVSDLRSY